jgi:hypothetical protein
MKSIEHEGEFRVVAVGWALEILKQHYNASMTLRYEDIQVVKVECCRKSSWTSLQSGTQLAEFGNCHLTKGEMLVQIHNISYTTVSYSWPLLILNRSIYARLLLLYSSQNSVNVVQPRSSATRETMEDWHQNQEHELFAENLLSPIVSGFTDSMMRRLIIPTRSCILQYSANLVPSKRIETEGDSDGVPYM